MGFFSNFALAFRVLAGKSDGMSRTDGAREQTLADVLDQLQWHLKTQCRFDASYVVKQLREMLGSRPISSLTKADFQSFFDARVAEVHRNTAAKELQLGRQAFRMAGLDHLIPKLFPKIRRIRPHRPAWTEEQIRTVWPHLDNLLRDLFLFALITGSRKQEVLKAEVGWVDLNRGTIEIMQFKTGQPKTFPYAQHPVLRDLIERRMARAQEYGSRWLFFRVVGGQPERIRSFAGGLRKALTAAGLTGQALTFHSLRHSFCTFTEQAGIPRSAAMLLSGHQNEAVFAGYVHPSADTARQAVQQLARAQEGLFSTLVGARETDSIGRTVSS